MAREDRPVGALDVSHDASTHGPRLLPVVPIPHGRQCTDDSDTAEHTLLVCSYWEGYREPLSSRFGHGLSSIDVPDIICGPDFDLLPADHNEGTVVLREAEEVYRLF